ncbi:hypothetical protein PRIPAC_84884 [Pristionchus pacificus]|uniref:Uncharacterized protein n=1 Tax=Pristionchus pacificus TaxID=54126 RepID=A0A2A6BMA7_PRIPA|nr:hypothetical protein PRIPAC_84884 [Pristionchus pacificus]|eukprot:PDM67039.1 hypothetical protein PRIPAC_48456 [Pristionchus pacificus]
MSVRLPTLIFFLVLLAALIEPATGEPSKLCETVNNGLKETLNKFKVITYYASVIVAKNDVDKCEVVVDQLKDAIEILNEIIDIVKSGRLSAYDKGVILGKIGKILYVLGKPLIAKLG